MFPKRLQFSSVDLIAAVLVGVIAGVPAGVPVMGCSTFEGARLYRSGSRALERGDGARAVSDLERAAELVPDASEIHNHLGLAYAAEGRHDEMRREFRRAVDLDCTNESARHNLRMAELDESAGERP
jgi:Tfp pilus assembly protein PilF